MEISLDQSLNSPFFSPPIGAEPGQAKRESRKTCMRMLRTPPFSPKSGENYHIWKYFSNLACGVIFWIIIYKQQFLHWDWLKTCQLTNPKSVEFHQCHAKPHSICLFFITISKITKEIFANICLQWKTPTRTWKCTRCIMQMTACTRQTFLSKTIRKKCLGKE